MTTRQGIEIESIGIILVAAAFGAFMVFRNNQNFQQKFHVVSPIVAGNAQDSIPPKIVTPSPTVERQSQISPDGKKNVILQITTNNNNTRSYDIFVQTTADNSQKLIYSSTLPDSSTLTIPFNTFSPDDKYFFITQTGATGQKVMAFLSSGDAFANGEQFYDITAIFANKITNYTFDQATGWASETLIIVNTKTADGSKGPSYWVELPSTAVIQLATEF